MAETVKRYRETAAWVVLGASAVYIVMSLARGGYLLAQGESVGQVARTLGGSSLSVVMVLLLVLVSLACLLVRPLTPHARWIVRAAATLVTVAAALEAVFLVVGLFGAPGGAFFAMLEVLGGLLEIAIKLAAAQVLWRVCAAHDTDRSSPRERPGDPEVASPSPVAGPASTPGEDPQEPVAASWSADQAVGAVWTRAGDAASGAAASAWGQTGGQARGWNVGGPEQAAELPAAPSGPWATAGELAAGEAPVPPRVADDLGQDSPDGRQVRWIPAPRGD